MTASSDSRRSRTTILLRSLNSLDDADAERIFPIVYEELRRTAHRELGRDRPDHTLSTTDLVHEAYLRLVDDAQLSWNDRAHFCAIAARCMRQILIDYARRRRRQKRGGDQQRITLKSGMLESLPHYDMVLSVDEALRQLSTKDERLVRVVECRFFGGMSVEETAGALKTSPRTVARDWNRAKSYLAYLLQPSTPAPSA